MNKFTRDKQFWRYQNRTILSLINQLEDETGTMFHEINYALDREIQEYLEEQSKYKARSKMITKLEEYISIVPASGTSEVNCG